MTLSLKKSTLIIGESRADGIVLATFNANIDKNSGPVFSENKLTRVNSETEKADYAKFSKEVQKAYKELGGEQVNG